MFLYNYRLNSQIKEILTAILDLDSTGQAITAPTKQTAQI